MNKRHFFKATVYCNSGAIICFLGKGRKGIITKARRCGAFENGVKLLLVKEYDAPQDLKNHLRLDEEGVELLETKRRHRVRVTEEQLRKGVC